MQGTIARPTRFASALTLRLIGLAAGLITGLLWRLADWRQNRLARRPANRLARDTDTGAR
ncbi:MAG: hypothetical protein HY678_11995 [Chloroflexi bacterium]|nr:hypothetical protein [Chloroflexota bacterium]